MAEVPPYVNIRRTGSLSFSHELFVEVDILPEDTVSRLAKRASKEYGWNVSPANIALSLLPEGVGLKLSDGEPVDYLEGPHLSATRPLTKVGVVHGSYLLAHILSSESNLGMFVQYLLRSFLLL